jgi:hypothetical protein
MNGPIIWLVAILLEIAGILFIGDDIITARAEADARPSEIVEDGATGASKARSNISPRWRAKLGVVLILIGLVVAVSATQA